MPAPIQNQDKDKNAPILLAARPDRMRDSLNILLKSVLGVNIIGQASDSSTALKMISEQHPVLVLLDTNLPGEGYAIVLQHIKSDGSSRCLVLADDVRRQRQARSAGADAALLKGFTTAELFETTERLLPGSKA
jgi:DNA-binding NarL/FixJ family response regulator